MPVLPRLSKRFYDVLGEDVADQLVEWLNAVEKELTDRARLRQENELHFARLEARMAQRLGSARPRQGSSRPSGELAGWRKELVGPREEFVGPRGELVGLGVWLRSELHQFRADLLRWMFLFWVTGIVGIAGLIVLLGQ